MVYVRWWRCDSVLVANHAVVVLRWFERAVRAIDWEVIVSKKETAMCAPAAMKPCLHIDFDGNANEVKGVAVGDEVYIVVRGKVKGVEQRESYEDPKKMMASVSLKDFEVKVGGSKSNIMDLFEDEGKGD